MLNFKLPAMIGQKLFVENEDKSISMIRIKEVSKDESMIMVVDCANGDISTLNKEELHKYTPLIPDGVCMFYIVKMLESETEINYDVMVTAYRMLNFQMKDTVPYCICRQLATDILGKQYAPDKKPFAGISINQDSCPKGVDFTEFLTCNEVIYVKMVNFYRNDTIEEILKYVDNEPYNDILKSIFNIHIASEKDPKLSFVSYHKGFCKTLEKLLQDNNFQADLDSMLSVAGVNFNLMDYTVEKKLPDSEETYDSINDELRDWLSNLFKVHIGNTTVIKYDHDIDLKDFNKSRYFFLRDKSKDVYMVVFTLDDEQHIEDFKELDQSKFELALYDKYNKNKK